MAHEGAWKFFADPNTFLTRSAIILVANIIQLQRESVSCFGCCAVYVVGVDACGIRGLLADSSADGIVLEAHSGSAAASKLRHGSDRIQDPEQLI
jgi:hypothetical protein